MPDLDKIERTLRPAWRPIYRMTRGQAPEEVARAIPKALARALREEGGATALPDFIQAVEGHDRGALDGRDFASVIHRLEHRMETVNGKLLARAALGPEVSGSMGILLGPPGLRLAFEFLLRKVDRELFSKQRNYLIGKRFDNRAEALRFEDRVLELAKPGIEELAKRLLRDPSAERLRAPRFRGATKKTTAELIDEPLF